VAQARLGRLEVPINERLLLPLKLDLSLPVVATVHVDQLLELSLDVPIRTVLTERELRIEQLEVPLDTEVFIDDVIDINTTLPIDTHVKTSLGLSVPVQAELPIRLKVPLRQKLRVRDSLALHVSKLKVPLEVTIPVKVQLPLKQDLHISGTVQASIKQDVEIPLKQILHPNLSEPIQVAVQLQGALPARIEGALAASVDVERPLKAQLGEIRVDARDVRAERRTPRP
jgi:hypothetical protein